MNEEFEFPYRRILKMEIHIVPLKFQVTRRKKKNKQISKTNMSPMEVLIKGDMLACYGLCLTQIIEK